MKDARVKKQLVADHSIRKATGFDPTFWLLTFGIQKGIVTFITVPKKIGLNMTIPLKQLNQYSYFNFSTN